MSDEIKASYDTLFGGRTIEVTIAATRQHDQLVVRQLPVAEYVAAFPAIDDEIKLAAIVCGKTQGYIESLSPESYEAVIVAVQEVNAGGFFNYAARRQDSIAKRLNSFKPEVLRMASEKTSVDSAPGLRPR